MSLEGLNAILTKEEIVATQRPVDLLERPKMVDGNYTKHVRSYIPLSRQAEDGKSSHSVSHFEKRVIRAVKDAAALRGYITAEYGYGKTSAALYLWKRAREANILAVPPFQMTRLTDLITASYGWLRYELKRTKPGSPLLQDADNLYTSTIKKSAESLAKEYGFDRAKTQRLIIDRPELLNLNTADYLRFFEEATGIARQAGFEGLLVLADEVQQYIDPEVKTGVKDPISPLFDFISGLLTRRNHLNMGLILILPPKELDVLRDQRGDFIHRMLQASLDLRTIYDRLFPARLWRRLAEEFDFTDHSHRIASPDTLESLGQISARNYLSDGPRTVINTFRRMTRRYLELGHPADDPYTPCLLIEDFLNGQIQFDSAKKIPKITHQALSHSLVKGHPDRERAVKWAAAFPAEGISRQLQEAHNLEKAFDALMQSAQGDLVISVGDISKRGITLRGLDHVETHTDALSVIIREFWRLYDENIETTRQRALKGFANLLEQKVFPDNQWQVAEKMQAGLTRNYGFILEGAFSSYSRKYPDRRAHVRILWEDETIKDADINGEFLIQFRLKRYLDRTEEKRRQHSEPLEINYEARQITLTLNLMYRDEAGISPTLDKTVASIVSPYKLTPLLMLALYESIEQKRANNAIPKNDDQAIRYGFQPDLQDNIFAFLFNPQVGAPVNAAQERILEGASRQLLDVMYPNYETLMRVGNWTSSLGKYRNALKHLELSHEKQGQMAVEGTKSDIAQLFTLSNTGLDTFRNNFSTLLLIQQPFPTQREIKAGKKGAVLFQLHPLERRIQKWLADSPDTRRQNIGGRAHIVHTMPTNMAYRKAGVLGYRDKEIDEVLSLMIDRGLIARDRRGVISEEINLAPSIDELSAEIEAWQKDIAMLLQAFSQSKQLRNWQDEAEKAAIFVNRQLRQKPDDEKAINARRKVQNNRRQLDDFVKDKHQNLIKAINQFEKSIPRLNPQHINSLNAPIKGGVSYVEQMNDLRARVLHQFNTLNNEIGAYRHKVSLVAAALVSDDLSIETLAKLANDYKKFQNQNEPLKEKCDARATDFERFNDWGRLVRQGSALALEIQELGDAVHKEREMFHQVSRNIMGHLSAEKMAALPDAPTYENQLQEIAEAVRAVKVEASKRFANLQDRYRQALTATLNFPLDKLWTPYSYNPADPDDSYRRLTQDVKSALQSLCRRLNESVAKLQDEVRRVLQDQTLKTMLTEERDSIEVEGESLLTQFAQLSIRLSELQPKISDAPIINDFPEEGEGEFHRLLSQIQPIPDAIGRSINQVKQLRARLGTLALNGVEQVVIDVLPQSGQIDFSELRQKTALSEDELWAALRGLYTKHRIRLPIELIRYD